MTWAYHLPLILWTNWIFVRRMIEYSAFNLFYERDCILSIELSLISWNVINWKEEIESREDLLMTWMCQLNEWAIRKTRATLELKRSWKENKIYFDQYKNIRSQSLKVDDLVLVYNTKMTITRMTKYKLDDKWYEFYCIREIEEIDYYRLTEIDGAELKESYIDNWLKKFFFHEELDIDRLKYHEII